MQTCDCCATRYHPQSDAWGETCGDCLAMQIELALLRETFGDARKPPKRAASQPALRTDPAPPERSAA